MEVRFSKARNSDCWVANYRGFRYLRQSKNLFFIDSHEKGYTYSCSSSRFAVWYGTKGNYRRGAETTAGRIQRATAIAARCFDACLAQCYRQQQTEKSGAKPRQPRRQEHIFQHLSENSGNHRPEEQWPLLALHRPECATAEDDCPSRLRQV